MPYFSHKPADRRQNRITRAPKLVTLPGVAGPPPPRREWPHRAPGRASGPPTSGVPLVTEPDMPALQRLHDLYDERERALRGYRKERVVTGSMVQAGNIGLIKTVSESILVLNDGVPSLLASTLLMAADPPLERPPRSRLRRNGLPSGASPTKWLSVSPRLTELSHLRPGFSHLSVSSNPPAP
jgi:hypothetical protein